MLPWPQPKRKYNASWVLAAVLVSPVITVATFEKYFGNIEFLSFYSGPIAIILGIISCLLTFALQEKLSEINRKKRYKENPIKQILEDFNFDYSGYGKDIETRFYETDESLLISSIFSADEDIEKSYENLANIVSSLKYALHNKISSIHKTFDEDHLAFLWTDTNPSEIFIKITKSNLKDI